MPGDGDGSRMVGKKGGRYVEDVFDSDGGVDDGGLCDRALHSDGLMQSEG